MTTNPNVDLEFFIFIKDGNLNDDGSFSIGPYKFKNDVIESVREIKNTHDKRIEIEAKEGNIYFFFQIIAYFIYSNIKLNIKKLVTKLICELFYKYAVIYKNDIVIDYFNNNGYSRFIPIDIRNIIDEYGNYELSNNQIIPCSDERKNKEYSYHSDSDDSTSPIRNKKPQIKNVSFEIIQNNL